MKYILGLDPGVASIGWGIIEYDENDNPIRIVDHGSVIFKPLDNDKGKLYNQVRREARGTRRVVRRRKERLRRIRNLILNTFDMKEAEYNDLFFKKGVVQDNDILELKVKGLSEELTKEQLIRVLIHYAKNRGFKSNRKIDADEEKGKMKSAIANVKKIMADNNYTVSKAILLYQKENDLAIRHNTNDNYNYGYERSDVKEEIDILLDKQIELGVIDEKFKKKYVEIWSSQRDYSEGPASGPYKVDWYKTFGRCRFDGNPRISRACPSFEFFTLIQKLQNLRYYLLDDNKERLKEDGKIKKYQLSSDDINELLKTARTKELKYSAIKKHLENKNSGYEVEIVDLPSISKSDFNKLVTKFKKDNDIDSKQKLNEFQYSKIKELAKEESLNKVLYSLNSFKDLKKQLKKLDDVKINDVEFMDDAATILSYAKTDKAIDKVIKEHYENHDFSKEEIELIKKLKTKISGTGSLSLDLTRQLITLMLDGKTYDEAMKELNHDHSKPLENVSFTNGFPTIKEIEQKYDTIITQPNVKHTLVYLRKLYNRIVETYGEPWKLHLELARDIRKPFLERLAIKHEQQSNYAANLDAKEEIWNTLGKADIENRNFKSFTAEDTLRFRLWKEQGGVCAYSQEIIEPNDVLRGRDLEVDHILPFSRSFDDSYNNKVLVYKKANQEKKNRTPYEWLGKHGDKTRWFKFKRWVENNKLLNDQKKNNLLYEEDVTFDEFSDRSLNSTGYISRLALQIFKDLLNCEDDQDRVRSFKGTATSYLRKYYRLNGYTHSYESARYLLKDTVYIIKDDGIKVEMGKDSASLKIVATDKFDRKIDTNKKYEKKNASFQNLKIEKSFDLLQTDTEFFINYAKDILVNKDLNSIDDYSILNTDDEIEYFLDSLGISPAETNGLINKEFVSSDTAEEMEIKKFIEGLNVDFPVSEVMSKAAQNIENAVYNHIEYVRTQPDRKILNWINMEYKLFKAVEESRYGSFIKNGFSSIEEFIRIANMVLNRRKSRAGKSLEHHLSALFDGNCLKYSAQAVTEGNKKPDFIFPSAEAYHDRNFSADKLISLAAKTTCKDRWRQVINEADRLRDKTKYLCTLQQGISAAQMDEMQAENVVLVVPSEYIAAYPADRRERIWSIAKFISYVKSIEEI